MRVIFLDIDGVLNNVATKFGRVFDGECVRWLNRITDRTGAVIVVSSTWRHAGIRKMREILRGNGVTGRVIGLTPDLSRKGIVHVAVARAQEIQRWFELTPGIEAFVILDDDTDMEHLACRHVQTASMVGLTEQDAVRAIKLLRTRLGLEGISA
jgi:hypothetical protein